LYSRNNKNTLNNLTTNRVKTKTTKNNNKIFKTMETKKSKPAFRIKTQYAIALTITAYFIIRCGVSVMFNV
jgi:hypothetical protein